MSAAEGGPTCLIDGPFDGGVLVVQWVLYHPVRMKRFRKLFIVQPTGARSLRRKARHRDGHDVLRMYSKRMTRRTSSDGHDALPFGLCDARCSPSSSYVSTGPDRLDPLGLKAILIDPPRGPDEGQDGGADRLGERGPHLDYGGEVGVPALGAGSRSGSSLGTGRVGRWRGLAGWGRGGREMQHARNPCGGGIWACPVGLCRFQAERGGFSKGLAPRSLPRKGFRPNPQNASGVVIDRLDSPPVRDSQE
jgi:hypothetical protein